MRLARILCAALALWCAALTADDFEQLRDAAARGDYSVAVPALQAAAARDDPRAIGLLASLYQHGRGFPHDAAKALSLYSRAAELGDADAQFKLGNMYRLGEGVPIDEAWALTYYRQAAAQGHSAAARNLDELYRASGLSPTPAAASVSPPVRPLPAAAAPPDTATAASRDQPAASASSATSGATSGPSDDELRAIELARAAGIEVVLDADAASPAPPVVPMPRSTAAKGSAEGPPVFTPSSAVSDLDTVENNEEGMAAYQTAQRHMRGQGVPRDQATGLQWLQRAARAGHVEAKFELALHYFTGQGVNPDEAMAITLLRDATQAGHPQARAKLKQVYAAAGVPMPALVRPQASAMPMSTGDRVAAALPVNAVQAPAERIAPALPTAVVAGNSDLAGPTSERHATRGAVAGMMANAAAEEESDLVEPAVDIEESVPASVTDVETAPQAQVAAVAKSATVTNTVSGASAPTAVSSLPQNVKRGESVALKPAATLADARAALDAHELTRAASIFTTLAERGDAEAQAHIGYMTYQGEGVRGDKAKAVQWYRKAALQGNRDAQYNLAVALAFGDGVARNDAEALQWYRRAAEQGSAVAQYSLGLSYALGDGAVQSDQDAIKWYSAAAEQGYADAQYNLGEMLYAGRGAATSEHDALHWFREAARNGNAAAQYRLGNFYRDGNGVKRDATEAKHWYQLAAAQGHREAQAGLAALQAVR